MPGGLTLLASTNANIPTPASGKVTIFFSLDSGVPSYKDSSGTVSPLGTNGATGAQGAIGPAIPLLNEANEIEPMMIPGPTGASGAIAGAGRLIGIQVITTTGAGTYTPTAGTGSVVIEGIGAGGGGGGVAAAGGGTFVALAQAGGGGGYFRKRLTTGFSGATINVGAKGTGGAAGNNAGNAGGNTTFNDGSTTYTATGGSGGLGSAGSTASPAMRTGATGGGATNGDVNVAGMPGYPANAVTSQRIIPGMGGMSALGYGMPTVPTPAQSSNISQAGVAANAVGKGAGGNAAISSESGGTAAGGDGTDGMLVIWEYSA